ncbi:type 1 fimbrial protein [Buttiauxella sp. B2]|uniref:fimbrial protein n=1 Tax=Buttiauxella sp. B2 TaxID=2587812 RepID=UPI0011225A2B|nr:fimbrial protein [Buttiauxella sp. B2]TNV22522.1 type 1 fimbrial protein [Buttiauxella sp. B2]
MNLKKALLAVIVSSVVSMGANAATDEGHGKITFKGSIIEAACSIDAKSLDQSIQLGAISKKHLGGGGKSTPVPLSIQLHDCDTDTAKTATVTFNGTKGDDKEGLSSGFAVTGQGAGVGVVITDLGGNVIAPGGASEVFNINDGDNELEFQAYVQGASASASVIPGSFQSVANFVMSYQ